MPPDEARRGTQRCVVAVLKTVDARHAAQIEAVDPRVEVTRVTDRTTWLEDAPDAEIIMGFRPLRDAAVRSQHLRWVHALGAGVENLCEDVAGTEILVTNCHIHGGTIADHVFAFILAHTRRLREAFGFQAARQWVHQELVAVPLAGRTMGILGLGTIGVQVARRAASFGMRVVGTKRHPRPIPGVDRVLPPEGIEGVLREASVLVLALPLTPATRGVLGAREIALLPDGSFVVNIARGGLVNEPALIAALRSGHLGGAGLDVFAEEPLPPESPLWTLPRVMITPHVAGDSPGYMDGMLPLFCENLARYLAGHPLEHVVDPAQGY